MSASCPFHPCQSLRQSPLAFTSITAPLAAGVGSGTSSMLMGPPNVWYSAALICSFHFQPPHPGTFWHGDCACPRHLLPQLIPEEKTTQLHCFGQRLKTIVAPNPGGTEAALAQKAIVFYQVFRWMRAGVAGAQGLENDGGAARSQHAVHFRHSPRKLRMPVVLIPRDQIAHAPSSDGDISRAIVYWQATGVSHGGRPVLQPGFF